MHSSDRAVIPSKYRHSSASPSMLTCCSQHNPVETYATYGRHLFSIDTRCDRAGTHLYSAGSSSITAVSDSSVDPHSLLLAVGKDIALMDRRFTKTFISKRSVGQATTMMKSIYGHSVLAGNGKSIGCCNNSHCGVRNVYVLVVDALLTSSCGATQILIHSIAHARNAATSPLGILQCGALPHGCSSSVAAREFRCALWKCWLTKKNFSSGAGELDCDRPSSGRLQRSRWSRVSCGRRNVVRL